MFTEITVKEVVKTQTPAASSGPPQEEAKVPAASYLEDLPQFEEKEDATSNYAASE